MNQEKKDHDEDHDHQDQKVDSQLLTLKDFEGKKLPQNSTPLDKLVLVASVALQKFNKQRKLKGLRKYSNPNHNDYNYGSSIKTDEGIKKGKISTLMPLLPLPSRPQLPQNFGQKISECGGTEIKLVLDKRLTKTDKERNNCRLSIPFRKIKVEFLRDNEKRNLEIHEPMAVQVIDPRLEWITLNFNRWNMPNKPPEDGLPHDTKCSIMYVLQTGWNHLVQMNDLQVDDLVHLWSFRVNERLCFALVLVEGGTRQDGDDGASTSRSRRRHKTSRRRSK